MTIPFTTKPDSSIVHHLISALMCCELYDQGKCDGLCERN